MVKHEINQANNSDASRDNDKQNQRQKKAFQQVNGSNDDSSKLNQRRRLESENGTGMENNEPLTYGYQRSGNNINGKDSTNQKEENSKRRENSSSSTDEENDDDNEEGVYSKKYYADSDANSGATINESKISAHRK